LFFTHDPKVALATVIKDAKGRFSTTDECETITALAS
jgi:hypothetical protein